MRQCYICNSHITDNSICSIELDLPTDIKLNSLLTVYHCKDCYFFFTDSGNSQIDYNNYYRDFNNYKDYVISEDKDIRCFDFIKKNISNMDVHSLIDYGCGNGELFNNLKSHYENVDIYDVNMEDVTKKYDCVTISHVLEHIYDLDDFIKNINNILNNDGYLYIEVPNMEYYEDFIVNGPLQEINIEHINFFSKYALNKLLIKHNFVASTIQDDFFFINGKKYYVIRGLFKKTYNNHSFDKYLKSGLSLIVSLEIDAFENLYIYGCGQFLFKILKKFKESKIINIIDDNKCYLNRVIDNKEIINFELFKNKVKSNDNIIITTIISCDKIVKKLKDLNIPLNIYYITSDMRVEKEK